MLKINSRTKVKNFEVSARYCFITVSPTLKEVFGIKMLSLFMYVPRLWF